MPSDLELSLPSRPATVPRMRNAAAELAEAAGVPERLVDDIRLAVSEAVTNSVRHGSAAGAEILMRVTLAPGRLTISVSDRGAGAQARDSDGLGLGIPIMTAVASHVKVAHAAHGRIVTMTFSWSR